ncbi:hypothetical protein Tco_0447098, partial [Tanacetum coccineum]
MMRHLDAKKKFVMYTRFISVFLDKEEVSTDIPDEGAVDQNKGRSAIQTAPTTTTPTIFGDDETIAQVLIIMSQNKEKL